MKQSITILVTLFIILSCKTENKSSVSETSQEYHIVKNKESKSLKDANGFSVVNHEDYKILSITNPWPKAENSFNYALIPNKNASKISLNKNDYNNVITTPVQKIVVTSTTHIPALELLGVEQILVGFPGTNYISSEKKNHINIIPAFKIDSLLCVFSYLIVYLAHVSR